MLKQATGFCVLSVVTEIWKLRYSFTLLVMAGMIELFLEVTLFGIVIKGAVLKVTIFYLADAILRHGRFFVDSFWK